MNRLHHFIVNKFAKLVKWFCFLFLFSILTCVYQLRKVFLVIPYSSTTPLLITISNQQSGGKSSRECTNLTNFPIGAIVKVFESVADVNHGKDSTVSRYRLAGTFFSMEQSSNQTNDTDSRMAIIDDKEKGTQLIIREGEMINNLRIHKIYSDHVIITDGDKNYELALNFSAKDMMVTKKISSAGIPIQADPANKNWLGGQRIGENSWLFSREYLMAYYQKLLDEPERLLAVFDSLKPVYDENNRINGYRVGIEGEKEFFDAVGFREGDIVKSVNTMKMTSRRRAEYFINEFVRDRVNVFLIEIERDNKPTKLMYHIR